MLLGYFCQSLFAFFVVLLRAFLRAKYEESGISSGYVLGGSAVMTDETARLVFGLNSDAVIVSK